MHILIRCEIKLKIFNIEMSENGTVQFWYVYFIDLSLEIYYYNIDKVVLELTKKNV